MSTKINTDLSCNEQDSVVMGESAPKKNKVKKVLPAVVLVTTFYYSSIFTLGLMLGYLATRLYCHKMGIDEESGDKIFFDVGKKWTIHLHHWIMGVIVIAFVSLAGWGQEIPIFLWGALFGMMAQDIYDYNDWHEVIIKKEEVKI